MSAAQEPPEEIAAELERQGLARGAYRYAPFDMLRRAIARRTAESFREVPHFGLLAKVEADRLIAARAGLNAEPGEPATLNDLIVKAAALALIDCPAVNVSFAGAGVAHHPHADIGVAVALEGGLVTPIVRAAETKPVRQISAEIKDLAARGRARRLAPSEYQGGSFAISNLGMFGVTSFGSVINPPHGAILSVGRAEKQHRYRGEDAYVATVIEVTLTCDHRVIDGATGARWLDAFRARIEAPEAWVD